MNKYKLIKCDLFRITGGKKYLKHILFDPEFKYVALYRYTHAALCSCKIKKMFLKSLFKRASIKYGYEIAPESIIGPGLRLVHRGGVCVHPASRIGANVTIFHGVTIGATRRGKFKGVPVIGNRVWIGSNATIVGKIFIGDDVLIAPNSYVNRDVPSHSICIGNPMTILTRKNATENYIDNICENLEDKY